MSQSSYQTYDWFLKNDFSNYSGKWIAVIGKKVVGSGDDVNKLIMKVKKEHPAKTPLITKIRDTLSIL